MKATTFKTNTKQRLIITFGIVAFILAIPLVAMQFTNEVNWKLSDFVVMGALLSITGIAIELENHHHAGHTPNSFLSMG
jgi:uncharacterized membrane protein